MWGKVFKHTCKSRVCLLCSTTFTYFIFLFISSPHRTRVVSSLSHQVWGCWAPLGQTSGPDRSQLGKESQQIRHREKWVANTSLFGWLLSHLFCYHIKRGCKNPIWWVSSPDQLQWLHFSVKVFILCCLQGWHHWKQLLINSSVSWFILMFHLSSL